MRIAPATPARPARRLSGVTLRALARMRGVTVHQVLMAIVRGEMRVRRDAERVLVTPASAAAWRPKAGTSAATDTAA